MDNKNKIPDHIKPDETPVSDGGRERLRPVFGEQEADAEKSRDFLNGFLEENPKDAGDGEFQDSAENQPELKERVIEAIQSIFDPEIPVNIYELGLIYGISINDEQDVKVTMTLTSPHCPVAESMPNEVQQLVEMVEGVRTSEIDLVWEPPWDPSLMSEAAQLELGFI